MPEQADLDDGAGSTLDAVGALDVTTGAHVARLGSAPATGVRGKPSEARPSAPDGLRLFAALAHELAQPLGAILADAECARWLVDRGGAPRCAEMADTLDGLRNSALRAAGILDAIRDLYLGTLPPMSPTNVQTAVTQVVASLADEAQRNNVDIRVHHRPGLPPVLAHAVLLERAVHNVVGNAVHAARLGLRHPGHVIVETCPANNSVAVLVHDDGPGLPDAWLDGVGGAAVQSTTGGLGLGLWLTHCILDQHGGALDVQAPVLGGATVALTFPVAGPPGRDR